MEWNIDMKNIDIVFISDEGYLMPTCVAIASIIENRRTDYIYNVYLVSPDSLGEDMVEPILNMYNRNENFNLVWKKIDVDDLQGLHNGNNTQYLASNETALLKFKLANIFPELDKILYLDGDILVLDNLIELFQVDLKENYVAAVRDLPQVLYDKQLFGEEINGKSYINSGVMLLNLKKIREESGYEKLVQLKKESLDYTLMDQNVLNVYFGEKILQLSFLYNVCYINLIESENRYDINRLNKMYHTSYKSAIEIYPDIKIMHFSSKLKPWFFFDVPMADKWFFYYKKSSFGEDKLQRIWHTNRNVNKEEIRGKLDELKLKGVEGREIIPIVFAANNEYAPYAAVAIQSIYENSSVNYYYDINILIDASMNNNMKTKLSAIKYDNVSVRLWDVRKCFEGINLYSVGHYSRQMYYRWLIPEIFSEYEKVLYLDCDLIVNADIVKLYEIDLEDNFIGAVNNYLRSNLESYVKNKLSLRVSEYFNSGVLLINTKSFILNNIKDKCIKVLAYYEKLACPDQDVINIACKSKIKKIEDKWNFQWHHQFPDSCKGTFLEDYEERYNVLLESEPCIIHYTSFIKPWSNPDRMLAGFFWKYCRNTFFYEEILLNGIVTHASNKKMDVKQDTNLNELSEENKFMKEKIGDLQYQLEETRKSKTYKIGRFITFIPRWVRHSLFKTQM